MPSREARFADAPLTVRAMPSLFERLCAAGEGSMAGIADRSAAIACIVRNLHAILNSNAGSVPTRPDWGLPDFQNLAQRMERTAPLLAQQIERQIEAFEPRLRQVRVRHRPGRGLFMIATFDVSGELVFDDESLPVTLQTRIHANGAVLVSRAP